MKHFLEVVVVRSKDMEELTDTDMCSLSGSHTSVCMCGEEAKGYVSVCGGGCELPARLDILTGLITGSIMPPSLPLAPSSLASQSDG